jgi:hypothetical protein
MSGADLALFPTGAGEVVTLPKGDLAQVGGASWLSDSKRIVFTGSAGPNIRRGYIQEIPRGMPRPITPDGVVLSAKAAVRDDDSVLGRVGRTWALFPIAGGDARPVPSLAQRDIPLQWSDDGRYVYTVDNVLEPRPPQVDVFRVELGSGSRVLWKTLTPPDPVGVEDIRTSVTIARDGETYCYSYLRRLGDLFVVDGLN